ncbi:Pkinase-domain-containing protein [Atractiella rhizophila]|nr:Pkinase-domain-containing protein [Atractiella rhizophila]
MDTVVRQEKVRREIDVLRAVKHPNIVRLFDVIETEKYIGIVLEYASGGELFDHILAHRYLRERDATRLFSQLISGVAYLHAKKVVHRDLKLENLLLDRNRNIIITDFGFANRFADRGDDLMSTSCGSPCYAAPELVVQDGKYVGTAVDVWSCGVILYAMLAGYLPFDDDPSNPDGDNINLLYKYIISTRLSFPDWITPLAREVLTRMLVPDPRERATLEEVRELKWLEKYREELERGVEELEDEADREQERRKQERRRSVMNQQLSSSSSPHRRPSGAAAKHQSAMVVPVTMAREEEEPMPTMSARPTPERRPTVPTPTSVPTPLPLGGGLGAVGMTSSATTAGISLEPTHQHGRRAAMSAIVTPVSAPPEPTFVAQAEDELPIHVPVPTSSTLMSAEAEMEADEDPFAVAKDVRERMEREQRAKEREEREKEKEKERKKGRARYTVQVEYDPRASGDRGEGERRKRSAVPTATKRKKALSMVIDPLGRSASRFKRGSKAVGGEKDKGKRSDEAHDGDWSERSVGYYCTACTEGEGEEGREPDEQERYYYGCRWKWWEEEADVCSGAFENEIERDDNRGCWSWRRGRMERGDKKAKKVMDWFRWKSLNRPGENTTPGGSPAGTIPPIETDFDKSPPGVIVTSPTNGGWEPVWTGKGVRPLFEIGERSTEPSLRFDDSDHYEWGAGAEDGWSAERGWSDDKERGHQNAVTPRQPQEIMDEIRKVLWNLGIEAQRDGEFKVKCIRKGKKKGGRLGLHWGEEKGMAPSPSSGGFKSFFGRQKSSNSVQLGNNPSTDSTLDQSILSPMSPSMSDDNSPSVSHPQPPTAYGESSVDSGDEIRFSIELTRLKNLTGLYSVDIRRIKGQLWGFGWVYNQVLQNMQLNNSSEAPREE